MDNNKLVKYDEIESIDKTKIIKEKIDNSRKKEKKNNEIIKGDGKEKINEFENYNIEIEEKLIN